MAWYLCLGDAIRPRVYCISAVKTASRPNEWMKERTKKLNEFFGCNGYGNKNHAYDTQMSIELPPSVAHAHKIHRKMVGQLVIGSWRIIAHQEYPKCYFSSIRIRLCMSSDGWEPHILCFSSSFSSFYRFFIRVASRFVCAAAVAAAAGEAFFFRFFFSLSLFVNWIKLWTYLSRAVYFGERMRNDITSDIHG